LIDTVPDILARIVARKREELACAGPAPDELAARAERVQRRDFRAALARKSCAIIAEIKKASPSKGVLSADFDPVRIACEYERGGAAALSVLTDQSFFQGSLTDLECARAAVEIPVLRKDFTLEEYHVLEAAASGADIIGINNRNLTNFQVTLDTSLRLAERMPTGVLRVSESGIHSSADIVRLQAAGYQAFLVGEHLMRAADPAQALRALSS